MLEFSGTKSPETNMPWVPTSEITTQHSRFSFPVKNKTPFCQVHILSFLHLNYTFSLFILFFSPGRHEDDQVVEEGDREGVEDGGHCSGEQSHHLIW